MGSIVLKSLSVLLGIFFVFVGTMKLTSHISKDLHKDLTKRKRINRCKECEVAMPNSNKTFKALSCKSCFLNFAHHSLGM